MAAFEDFNPNEMIPPGEPNEGDLGLEGLDSAWETLTKNMASLSTVEINTVFRDLFGIEFDRITRLQGKLIAKNFYLAFPPGKETECQFFQLFLRANDANSMYIDSDNLSNWKVFSSVDEPGCIVVSANYA
jgi:hypothetical protein